MYVAKYHPEILNCLEKYPHLKNRFRKKKDYILQNPKFLGEPLKKNLNGLRSFPLARHFIIIYLVCEDCRELKQQDINNCFQCEQIPEESVIFLLFGPHDFTYKSAMKIRKELHKKDLNSDE